MPSLEKTVTKRRAPLDARGVSRVLKVLRREAPTWNAPIVSFIAVQHRDPFRTLISCILSLRTKDATTAAASSRLFARAHTAEAILGLSPKTLERLIFPVGFYRTKARVIPGICRDLIDKFDGRVPDEIDALLTLKGVGRKTANLVVTEAFRGYCQRAAHPEVREPAHLAKQLLRVAKLSECFAVVVENVAEFLRLFRHQLTRYRPRDASCRGAAQAEAPNAAHLRSICASRADR